MRDQSPTQAWSELVSLTALSLLSLGIRLIPFISHGSNPLGYDTGFYRRYLTQPPLSFPNTPVPGLGDDALVPRMLLDLLRFIHLSPDVILYGSYIACFLALPILFYIYLRPYAGTRGAYIAALLVSLSSVQYVAYWYMLLKSAFALCLLVSALIALERQALWPLLLLDLLIATSHKTTALIYLLTLGVLFVLYRGRRKDLVLHGSVMALGILAVNATLPHELSTVSPIAVFLSWGEYIRLSLPLFLALIFGWRGFKGWHVPRSLIAVALVACGFVALRLPFYERVFVYSDIALIGLASYGVAHLLAFGIAERKTLRGYGAIALLCIMLGMTLGNLRNDIRSYQPLIHSGDIKQIETIATLVPTNATILTSSDEAPWYEGWTNSHIAAPGLLQDRHNFEAWEAFWMSTSTPQKIEFLKSLPHPLYISTLGSFDFLIGTPPACLTKLSPVLLRDDCANIKE